MSRLPGSILHDEGTITCNVCGKSAPLPWTCWLPDGWLFLSWGFVSEDGHTHDIHPSENYADLCSDECAMRMMEKRLAESSEGSFKKLIERGIYSDTCPSCSGKTTMVACDHWFNQVFTDCPHCGTVLQSVDTEKGFEWRVVKKQTQRSKE